MEKFKRPFRKSKGSFRRHLPPIGLGDRIDYRNMSLISRFIMNRLTLKQQRLITIAIKQARIFCLLHFLDNEKQFERAKSIFRTTDTRTRKK
ncbi:unnamed protein product [Victoria cruziana]